jgi:hypothetical protein
VLCTSEFNFVHFFSSLLTGLAASVATEGTGGSELAQLVTDHVFGDVHGNMTATVMDSDSVANERGENGGGTGPSLNDLLVASLIHFFDSLHQLGCYEGALLNASAHLTFPPYFALRRLTMNLSVRFLVLRVL